MMHNAMHSWGKSGRDLGKEQGKAPEHHSVLGASPQPRDVVPTRYAALMTLSHKSTSPATTGFKRIYPRAEADRRKS
jgi:hypothetical protein